jgi:hypothetical protein
MGKRIISSLPKGILKRKNTLTAALYFCERCMLMQMQLSLTTIKLLRIKALTAL